MLDGMEPCISTHEDYLRQICGDAQRHLWSKSAMARVDLGIDEFDRLYRSAVVKTNNALVEYINEHGLNSDL